MQIVTPQIGGNDIIHYQAPPSGSMPQHMQQRIAWFNASQGQVDGIARAAIAHLWLEAIHPFEGGNGRIGRALRDLALAHSRNWAATQAAHPAHPAITGLSRATAYRELTQLLDVGLLVKTGVGKATRYGLA